MTLTQSYRNWRTYRNTLAELERLSARELNDLGIARADIRRIARSAVI